MGKLYLAELEITLRRLWFSLRSCPQTFLRRYTWELNYCIHNGAVNLIAPEVTPAQAAIT
jgi:hypothetical protein